MKEAEMRPLQGRVVVVYFGFAQSQAEPHVISATAMCHSCRGMSLKRMDKNSRDIVHCESKEDILAGCRLTRCSIPESYALRNMIFGKAGKKSGKRSV